MITSDHVLSSDVDNTIFMLKKVRELPIVLQGVFHDMMDICLNPDSPESYDSALYTIYELFEL